MASDFFILFSARFIQALLDNLEQRFPEDAQVTLKALNIILNPKALTNNNAEVALFGQNELDYLLQRYGQENQNIVNAARCRQDFLAYKHFVGLHRNKSFPEFCEILIKDQSDVFPDFVVFAELALVVPLNSASCERGFSAQNRIKSKSRNRLRDEQVDRLMKIIINGPHYAEYDYTAAKNNFRAMKDRIQ